VRGKKRLFSDTSGAEVDGGVDSRGSDGFTLTGGQGTNNESGHTYVAWNWKAGTAFSNDASSTGVGTIDSSGSVNTDVGFSIISYTGTGSNATVAHGLSSAPDVVLVKGRSNDSRFWTYWGTQFDANTTYIYLNETAAEDTGGATITNSAYPTSSVFSIGTSTFVNGSSETYIAYCFHEVEGYSKFGKYIGNGNSSGMFVYTGFRPAFVLIKSTTAVESWNLFDTARDPSNLTTQNLNPNVSNAESDASSGNRAIDILSNGFKLRGDNSAVNDGTFLYLAFAEQPFKYANAR
jgi:hypothetical protein